jgi:hypothetical protein
MSAPVPTLGTTNPSIISRNILGIPYTVTIDPYQVDASIENVVYLRYQSTDRRCWIQRVTTVDNITTLEKSFGQWDSRIYLTYVPINDEYGPEYFTTLNFDRYYVMSLMDPTLNETYYYRGRKITYDSSSGLFDTLTATKPMFEHANFSADVDPIQAMLIYDTYLSSWVLMTGDPEDVLVPQQDFSMFPATYRTYIVPSIGADDKPFCGTYLDIGLRWTYIPDIDPEAPGAITNGTFVAFKHPAFESDPAIPGVVAYNPDASTWDLYEVLGADVPYLATIKRANLDAPVLIEQPIPPAALWPDATRPSAIVSLTPLTNQQIEDFTVGGGEPA